MLYNKLIEQNGGNKVARKSVAFKDFFKLFSTFLKIGAFTFGGGYAMIPLIRREAVEKQGWISDDDVLEIIAVAESTPGPIAINAATFVGMRVAGVFGAVCATLGVVLPSFVIISVIAFFLKGFSHIKAVEYAFKGIRIGVLALILGALISMIKTALKSVFAVILALSALVLVAFLDVSAIAVIVICAAIGLAFSFFEKRRKAGKV